MFFLFHPFTSVDNVSWLNEFGFAPPPLAPQFGIVKPITSGHIRVKHDT